ncbi:unnamed protein product [Heterobilharzia americana]|nr:unnamed protein product [Heterobilharzia americana]
MFEWSKREQRTDVTWMLDALKRIMGETSSIRTFVIACARVLKVAIKTVFPNVDVVLCAFHVCRAMCKRTRNPTPKQYLCRLFREESTSRFYAYNRIINAISLDMGRYLSYIWMNCKRLWSAAFYNDVLTLGNNANSRVESLRKQIKRRLRKCDKLHISIWKAYQWHTRRSERKKLEMKLLGSEK